MTTWIFMDSTTLLHVYSKNLIFFGKSNYFSNSNKKSESHVLGGAITRRVIYFNLFLLMLTIVAYTLLN